MVFFSAFSHYSWLEYPQSAMPQLVCPPVGPSSFPLLFSTMESFHLLAVTILLSWCILERENPFGFWLGFEAHAVQLCFSCWSGILCCLNLIIQDSNNLVQQSLEELYVEEEVNGLSTSTPNHPLLPCLSCPLWRLLLMLSPHTLNLAKCVCATTSWQAAVILTARSYHIDDMNFLFPSFLQRVCLWLALGPCQHNMLWGLGRW